MSKSTTPQNPFGRRISQADAQRMYKNFYKIKSRALDKFRDPFVDDTEALRYHGGLYDEQPTPANAAPGQPKQYNCCFLDTTFVFEVKALRDLLKYKGENGKEAEGIAIFLGTRDKEDSCVKVFDNNGEPVLDNNGIQKMEYNDVDGRPTLLVFPFTYEGDAEPKWKDAQPANIVLGLDDGLEHPGTGGDGGGGTSGGGTANEAGAKSTVGPQPSEINLPIPSQLQKTYAVQSIHHIELK